MPDGARADYVLSDVRKFFGHALDFAQRGDQHDAAKVMKGFGSLQTSIVCFTFHYGLWVGNWGRSRAGFQTPTDSCCRNV